MHYGFLLVGISDQYDEFLKKKKDVEAVILDYFKASQIQNLVFFHPKMAYHSITMQDEARNMCTNIFCRSHRINSQ